MLAVLLAVEPSTIHLAVACSFVLGVYVLLTGNWENEDESTPEQVNIERMPSNAPVETPERLAV